MKGIFLRPTGSGSLWKQAVGATRWRNIFFFFEETWCFDVICKSRNIYRCHCWTMTSAPNIHSKVIYECCEAPYLDITVYLMLRWLYRGMFGKRPDFFLHFPLFPQHPHVPFPGAEHFTISPIWSGHVSSLPGLQKDFLRISDQFTLFTFECMLFQHGCSRFQFPAWLWGKGVHVIISDQKRILSPQEIEYCLIL